MIWIPGPEPDLDPGGQLFMDPSDLDPVPEHWKQAYVYLKQDVDFFASEVEWRINSKNFVI
jgi:hypothetical protein